MDFAEARFYNFSHGRFTSPDEFKGGPDELFDFEEDASDNPTFYADLTNPQSLNKYLYTYNNPYKFNDPDGHCPLCALSVQEYLIPRPIVETGLMMPKIAAATEAAAGSAIRTGAIDPILVPTTPLPSSRIFAPRATSEAGGSVNLRSRGPRTPRRGANPTSGKRGGREGKNFTPKDKRDVIDRSRNANDGKTRCNNCGVETIPGKKTEKGVPRPPNETQVDHIHPKSKGGSGTPDNGQVLCRTCDQQRGAKVPEEPPLKP